MLLPKRTKYRKPHRLTYDGRAKGNTTFLGAFLQIGNTILGAGIISLPVVFRYLGFILGFIFITIIAILTIYSSYLLLHYLL